MEAYPRVCSQKDLFSEKAREVKLDVHCTLTMKKQTLILEYELNYILKKKSLDIIAILKNIRYGAKK